MTLGQALDKAATEIDRILERQRCAFEQSLIDNLAPIDAIPDLLRWQHEQASTWRARTLAQICQWLVEP